MQCLPFALIGCSKRDDRLEQVKTPMWNDSDIEARKLKENQSVYVYSVIEPDRPKYYNGRMPLYYQAGYPPWGMRAAVSGKEIPLFYDFGDFKNWFIYQGPHLVGARTQDKSGILLAKARLRYFVTDDGRQGIEAEEVHYGADGKPAFSCRSKISDDDGFKVAEEDRIGRKTRDYYFIWPKR